MTSLAQAPTTQAPRRIAVCLDAYLSEGVMDYAIRSCQRLGAGLLALATPPGALAVTRLEYFLPALERAGVDWEIQPVPEDAATAIAGRLAERPGVQFLVCAEDSILAQALADASLEAPRLPVPLVVTVRGRNAGARQQAKPASVGEVDWLHPLLHRGF